jgi:hypothetical protein
MGRIVMAEVVWETDLPNFCMKRALGGLSGARFRENRNVHETARRGKSLGAILRDDCRLLFVLQAA